MSKLKTILLVEDNELDAELTIEALSEPLIANEIIHLRDGEEVLDYLYARGNFAERNTGNPGLILLDLKMPKLDGLEVLRVIKADSQLRTIPVIMLTSSREEQDLVESYHLGVNAYMVKPVDFNQFIDGIKSVGAFWGVFNEAPPQITFNQKDEDTGE